MGHGVYDSAADPDSDEVLKNPVKRTRKSLARGKKLFIKNCVSCHGLKGHGDGPKSKGLDPKVANLRKIESPNESRIFKQISSGPADMPNWSPKLKKKQIWELTNYIMSINPKK